tara:strand:+ start:168 stop:539 length:372 start_codon:yes stop_codon:yes gene_type:complete
MTIRLLLLKSGEDIIADVSEMAVGEEEKRRVVGYFLNRPCVIKMRDPNILPTDDEDSAQKAGFSVSLFPWMPLAKDETIPITSDWVITIVEPMIKLKEMYLEDIVNYGKANKDSGTSESTDSN